MKYFEVELLGTQLGDTVYIKAADKKLARKKVYSVLLKENSGIKSYVPGLKVTEISKEDALGGMRGSGTLGIPSGPFPKNIDTYPEVKKLESGKPVFDYD